MSQILTSSPTQGHEPWGQILWHGSWLAMVQIWMLSEFHEVLSGWWDGKFHKRDGWMNERTYEWKDENYTTFRINVGVINSPQVIWQNHWTVKCRSCRPWLHNTRVNVIKSSDAWPTTASARRGPNTSNRRHFLMYKNNLSMTMI